MQPYLIAKSSHSLAVSPTLASVSIAVPGYTRLALHVRNTGAAALTACNLRLGTHPEAPSVLFAGVVATYTTPVPPLVRCATPAGVAVAMTTLAAGAEVIAFFDFRNFAANTLILEATAASSTNLALLAFGIID